MSYEVKSVSNHATGLRLPTHLGLAPNGDLFVSEMAGGTVRNVTECGEYGDCRKRRHTCNLVTPGGILPVSDGRLLVADSGAGTVVDITKSGSAGKSDVIFDGTPNPYSLVEFDGRVFVSFYEDGAVGIVEVREGHTFRSSDAIVHDFPCVYRVEPFPSPEAYGGSWATTAFGNRLLMSHSELGSIFDVSKGGSYSQLRHDRFAWGLSAPGGMIGDPYFDELYVCERRLGAVRRITKGGYARFARSLVTGFKEPSCIRFSSDGSQAFVVDKSWGAIYRVELSAARDAGATQPVQRTESRPVAAQATSAYTPWV